MGNRVKGRVKRKSVKAAMAKSAVGSARKLSRMGKKVKKHHAGVDATFIGRSKCLKMLQITLKDFRRLCILKGIYPREPVNATPKNKRGQTLYHAKDIKAVAHEPVLQKFRDVRAFMKKVRRAAGRNERDEAARKHAAVPAYTLHHLVKERYPRFRDAVADLDDGLTVVYLFAALPGRGSDNDDIRPAVIQRAKTIAAAWGAYCAAVSAVTKCFVSVKGVYVEAAVLPAVPAVRWIIPHAFTQHMPDEVDYRVMMTFFEFYETLLNFVLFKLYHGIGIRYPVNLAAAADDDAAAAAGGTTATLLHAHLRALSAGFESQSGAGAVSSVVAESVQAVSSKKDHGTDGNMVEADGDGDADSKKKQKKAKQKKKDSRELIKSVSAALNKLKEEEEENDNDSDEDHDENSSDAVDVAGPLEAALKESVGNVENGAEDDDGVGGGPDAAKPLQAVLQDHPDAAKRRCLFQGLTFFLSREVPRGYLELVSLSHGAVVGWEEGGTGSAGSGAAGSTADCSPVSASDKSITHYICDRPKPPVNKKHWPANREYVQPQWILDSANFQFLLPVSRYRTGCSADLLPPHLSPWVDNEEEGYTPAYAAEIAKLKSGGGVVSAAAVEDDDDDDDDDEDEEHAADQKDDQGHDKNSDVEKREEKAKRAAEDKDDDSDSDDDDDESEDSNDDDNSKDEMTEDAEKHQNDKKKRRRNYNDSDDDDDEAKRLARSMMSRKAAHLYGRMQHGIAAKKAKVDALHQRRKEIDQSKKKDSESGKSVQKQKVERLKKHRKDIEDTYSNGEGNSMKKKKKKRTHKKHHDKKKNKTNA